MGRPRKEKNMDMEETIDQSIASKEIKAGGKLLEQALKKYKCPRDQLLMSESTGAECWTYYQDGGVFSILNPKWDKKIKAHKRPPKYIVINQPTICFVTNGGMKRYYYEGYEDHVSFKPLKDFQCDGIVRKEAKSSYF